MNKWFTRKLHALFLRYELYYKLLKRSLGYVYSSGTSRVHVELESSEFWGTYLNSSLAIVVYAFSLRLFLHAFILSACVIICTTHSYMLQFLRKVFVNGGTKYFKGEPIFSEIFGPKQTNFVEVFSPGGPLVGGPIFWWQLCSTTAPSLVLWPGRRLSPASFTVWSKFDLPRVWVAMSCGRDTRIILSRSQAEREEKDPVTDCLTMHSWLLQFQSKTLIKSQCSKVQFLPERIYILSSRA